MQRLCAVEDPVSSLCQLFPSLKSVQKILSILYLCCPFLSINLTDMDDPLGDDVGYPGFKTLPFGAVEDPINELHLRATWPSVAEETVVDNDVYS